MKSLGINVDAGNVRLVILDGDKGGGVIEFLSKNAFPIPSKEADCPAYIELAQAIKYHIQDRHVTHVGVIKAFPKCSIRRAKAELAIQMGCFEAKVPYEMISIITIRSLEKGKVEKITGKSLWSMYNTGAEISPKYLVESAYAAWWVLNNAK